MPRCPITSGTDKRWDRFSTWQPSPDPTSPLLSGSCRHVEAPTERDWKSVKRVIRYLATTIDRKLRLPAESNGRLTCFVDADWAGERLDRKSMSGYTFFLGDSLVAWSSKKQSVVAQSSTEAEYIALSHAGRELLWLRQLLRDLDIPVDEPTTVYEDNQSSIKLVESERSTRRTKHIDVFHHFMRDLQATDVINVLYCSTEAMIADVLTKPLPKDSFRSFVQQLGIED